MPMQPSTDDNLDKLPHVITTSDTWDPTVLDHSFDLENDIYHPAMDSNIMVKILNLLMRTHL